MAQPSQPPVPPPFPFPAVESRGLSQSVVAGAVAVMIFVVFFAIVLVGMFGPPFSMFFAAPLFCIPFLFVIVLIIITVAQGFGRRSIPPPPPIQQPMVPAGQQGPVTLDCPNCGGPPSSVDRFGIAVCSYCGTRFLVR